MPTKNLRGVTLFELIISVAIISISFYVLISVFSLVAVNSSDSRDATIMYYLAQGKMEEYIAKCNSVSPGFPGDWTNFSKAEEAYPTTRELNYPGRFSAFAYKVMVDFVDKKVDPIVTSEAGGINDLLKLTVAVKSIKIGGQDYIRSVSTILPSRLQK